MITNPSSWIDQAGPLRAGEPLDVAAIDAFLKSRIPTLSGELTVRQYPGGASNLTYQLIYPDCELVLRRPPFGHKAKSAHDMVREAKVMQALRPVYPLVPEVLAVCEDDSVIGSPFFVMERLRGIILRRDLPPGLSLDEAQTRQLADNMLDGLCRLHSIDVDSAGLTELGKGEGYVARQVAGWSKRYRDARTEDVPDYEQVIAWLSSNMPLHDTAIRVVHNDYRFDNVVLDLDQPTRVIGVLDWELATLGDPLMDLGNSLAYWVEASDDPAWRKLRRQPTHLVGMPTRRQVLDAYQAKTGIRVTSFDYYLAFGLFRLAVIAQQIYYRFFHGQTRVPEFGSFGQIVTLLERRTQQAIESHW
ncbi:MAG: phosphotransferase family protein [Myxococcales bacterium]|nr:phosphotransferase family protein [Myxococcales bacterium]